MFTTHQTNSASEQSNCSEAYHAHLICLLIWLILAKSTKQVETEVCVREIDRARARARARARERARAIEKRCYQIWFVCKRTT